MRYINELTEDERVIDVYLCKQKQSLKSRNGKTYYSLRLQDKTGIIDAKVWDLTKDIQNFNENDYIKIDASVVTFNNEYQLKVVKVRKSEEGEYDPKDYIPSTSKDITVMYKEIESIVNDINDEYIKKLLKNILARPDIKDNFKSHSAAKTMHHNYMGGLLEHTLSVTQLCLKVAEHYGKMINKDLLVCYAILHDIGKVKELSSFPENDYTDEGQLLGHLIIGTELVGEEARKIEGFPKNTENLIKHGILSHHGKLEYGSPKLPATMEAFVFHMIDEMDAKTKMIEDLLTVDNGQGVWVGYNRMLERNLRKTDI